MASLSSDGAALASDHLCVAVISPEDSPCLDMMPDVPGARFLVHNDVSGFQTDPLFPNVSAIVFVAAGGKVDLVPWVFEASKNISWVHSFFAGVDALGPFIKSHLQSSDVPLTNGRGAFSSSLAEYVLASALHFNKKVTRCQRNVIDKRWDKFVMPTLAGKTMGFVGFGHIGQTTARLAKAFGMKVKCLRRDKNKMGASELADAVYGPEGKMRLLNESDFVVSVLPGTPETIDFFGKEEFAMMKPDSVFISVGRGVVVDEGALACALHDGTIAGAALDVFKTEPLPQNSPLWGCGEKILMTAHNADYTDDYFALGWKVWQDNLEAMRTGGIPLTVVDKELGY